MCYLLQANLLIISGCSSLLWNKSCRNRSFINNNSLFCVILICHRRSEFQVEICAWFLVHRTANYSFTHFILRSFICDTSSPISCFAFFNNFFAMWILLYCTWKTFTKSNFRSNGWWPTFAHRIRHLHEVIFLILYVAFLRMFKLNFKVVIEISFSLFYPSDIFKLAWLNEVLYHEVKVIEENPETGEEVKTDLGRFGYYIFYDGRYFSSTNLSSEIVIDRNGWRFRLWQICLLN